MYYNYCAECGTEVHFAGKEPKDGTPIVCPYCGTRYGYKSLHHDRQWLVIKCIIGFALLCLAIKGCDHSKPKASKMLTNDEPITLQPVTEERIQKVLADKEIRKKNNSENVKSSETEVIDLSKVNIRLGFGVHYQWGDDPVDCNKRMPCTVVCKVKNGGWFNEIEFNYKEGVGLVSVNLLRKNLWKAELVPIVDEIIKEWGPRLGKNSYNLFTSDQFVVERLMPKNEYVCLLTALVKDPTEIRLCIGKRNLLRIDEDLFLKVMGLELDK